MRGAALWFSYSIQASTLLVGQCHAAVGPSRALQEEVTTVQANRTGESLLAPLWPHNETTQANTVPSDPTTWSDHGRRVTTYGYGEPHIKINQFERDLWGCLVAEFHDV